AHAYDARTDGAHSTVYDGLVWGLDLALGYGGFSMTAAYTVGAFDDFAFAGNDHETTALLVQAGYLFPGTAWEVAARYSVATDRVAPLDSTLVEMAAVVNYYLNGHANKLSLDVTALTSEDDDTLSLADPYSGLRTPFIEADDLLVRFQWQLAL
ncbi:MAG: porin, partial [Candidatus Limnocylindrus sp.]